MSISNRRKLKSNRIDSTKNQIDVDLKSMWQKSNRNRIKSNHFETYIYLLATHLKDEIKSFQCTFFDRFRTESQMIWNRFNSNRTGQKSKNVDLNSIWQKPIRNRIESNHSETYLSDRLTINESLFKKYYSDLNSISDVIKSRFLCAIILRIDQINKNFSWLHTESDKIFVWDVWDRKSLI